MPTYKAKERGYIQSKGVIEAGQQFEYDGPQGKWMELIDDKPTLKIEENPKDIMKVAESLAKNPPSVWAKEHIPQAIVSVTEKEPVKMTSKIKGKR